MQIICSGMYSTQGSKISTEFRGQNVMEEKPVTGTTLLEYETPHDISQLTQTTTGFG